MSQLFPEMREGNLFLSYCNCSEQSVLKLSFVPGEREHFCNDVAESSRILPMARSFPGVTFSLSCGQHFLEIKDKF